MTRAAPWSAFDSNKLGKLLVNASGERSPKVGYRDPGNSRRQFGAGGHGTRRLSRLAPMVNFGCRATLRYQRLSVSRCRLQAAPCESRDRLETGSWIQLVTRFGRYRPIGGRCFMAPATRPSNWPTSTYPASSPPTNGEALWGVGIGRPGFGSQP